MRGAGMIADKQISGEHEGLGFSGWQLKTEQAVKQLDIQLALRIEQDPTIATWEKGVSDLEGKTINRTRQDWNKTRDWWRSFWNRSYIVINPEADKENPAWKAGRNYQLFRAMLAANSSGRFPNLFNGAAFTFEANPDSRQWGHAGFTAQNQRGARIPATLAITDSIDASALVCVLARRTRVAKTQSCHAPAMRPAPGLAESLTAGLPDREDA